MRVSKKEMAGVTILLCIVCVLLFWKIVFKNNIYQINWETYSIHNSWDELEQFYPWRYYAAQAITTGVLPLWNPFVSSGAPLVANNMAGVFYPLSILFYLFSVERSFAFTAMLHIFIAGFMMYIFLRLNNLVKTGALIGAIIFAINGTAVTKFSYPDTHVASIWLPIILISLEKFLISKKIHFAYFAGLCLGVGALAGNLQDIYNGVILLFFYSLFKVYYCYKPNKRELLMYVRGLIAIILISLMIGAIQIFTTLELVGLTDHRSLSSAQVLKYALGWKYLNNLIITPILTDPKRLFSLNAIEGYIGIAGIVLLFTALWFRKRKEVYFYGAIGLVFLLAAIGDPVYRLFRILPGFKCLNAGAYMLDMFVFSAAVLAALGYESIADNMGQGGKQIRNFKVGLAILALVWLSWIWLQPAKYESIKLILTTVYLLLIAGWSILKRPGIKLVRGELLFLLVLLDLLWVGMSYSMNQVMTSAPGNVITHLQELNNLKGTLSAGRIIRYRTQIYPPNTLMVLGLSDAQGFDTFTVSKYGAFMNLVEENIYIQDSEDFRIHSIQQGVGLQSVLLDLLNVKYILTSEEIVNPKYKKIYAEYNPIYKREVIIYENLNVMPRAFIVFREKITNDDNLLLSYCKNKGFDPAKEIIIDADFKGSNLAKNSINSAINGNLPVISRYGYNEVELNTDTNRKGWLFLGDTYYPGWKAYVDGKRVNIYRANYTFRAILLEPGRHFIKFIYDPFSFKFGLYLLIGVVILGTILSIRFIRVNRCI